MTGNTNKGVNTIATVYIPAAYTAAYTAAITESGLALANSKDIRVPGSDKGYVHLPVVFVSYRLR